MRYYKIAALLLATFFLQQEVKCQDTIKGYYISFGCCFEKDSVTVFLAGKRMIYRSALTSEPSTGLCNAFFFLKSKAKKQQLTFRFTKQTITMQLPSVEQLQFVSIYKQADGRIIYTIKHEPTFSE